MELSRYLFQTCLLGATLLWLGRSWISHELGSKIGALYAVYWTSAVAFIYVWQGESQAIFYSSDQVDQFRSILSIQRDGVELTLDAFIGRRYLISIPASWLVDVGVEPLLAYKFLQGMSVLALLAVATYWSRLQGLDLRPWHFLLVAGPSLLLNSVLALRDSVLAAAVATLLFGRSTLIRAIGLFVVFGLRPQLGVAIILGFFLAWLTPRLRRPVATALVAIGCYVLGGVVFDIANTFLVRSRDWTTLFLLSQAGIWRLLRSFVGLQFLSVNPDTVNLDFGTLLLLRLVFIDTWLAPLMFVVVVLLFSSSARYSVSGRGTLYAFCVYIGIASQTDFTSSRQSLPFFAVFALLALRDWKAEQQLVSQGEHSTRNIGWLRR